MKTLYNSLSGLLMYIEALGMEAWKDDSNTFYFFGCTKEGAIPTFVRCAKNNSILNEHEIFSILNKAESEGRLRYRTDNLESDENWFSNVLGVPMELIRKMTTWGLFNLPRMEEILKNLGGFRVIRNQHEIIE